MEVVEVSVHAFSQRTRFFYLPPVARYLGQSGDAGHDEVPVHVVFDGIRELLCVPQHVRAGPDDGHFAFEHVDELGKFIKTGFAQKRANFRYPAIIFAGLFYVCIRI